MLKVNIFLLVFCILSVNCNSTYSGSGWEDSDDTGFSFFPVTALCNKSDMEHNIRAWKEDRVKAQYNADILSCLCLPVTGAVDCATLPFRLIYFAGKKAFTKDSSAPKKKR